MDHGNCSLLPVRATIPLEFCASRARDKKPSRALAPVPCELQLWWRRATTTVVCIELAIARRHQEFDASPLNKCWLAFGRAMLETILLCVTTVPRMRQALARTQTRITFVSCSHRRCCGGRLIVVYLTLDVCSRHKISSIARR